MIVQAAYHIQIAEAHLETRSCQLKMIDGCNLKIKVIHSNLFYSSFISILSFGFNYYRWNVSIIKIPMRTNTMGLIGI